MAKHNVLLRLRFKAAQDLYRRFQLEPFTWQQKTIAGPYRGSSLRLEQKLSNFCRESSPTTKLSLHLILYRVTREFIPQLATLATQPTLASCSARKGMAQRSIWSRRTTETGGTVSEIAGKLSCQGSKRQGGGTRRCCNGHLWDKAARSPTASHCGPAPRRIRSAPTSLSRAVGGASCRTPRSAPGRTAAPYRTVVTGSGHSSAPPPSPSCAKAKSRAKAAQLRGGRGRGKRVCRRQWGEERDNPDLGREEGESEGARERRGKIQREKGRDRRTDGVTERPSDGEVGEWSASE
jgi:hypothetical protein